MFSKPGWKLSISDQNGQAPALKKASCRLDMPLTTPTSPTASSDPRNRLPEREKSDGYGPGNIGEIPTARRRDWLSPARAKTRRSEGRPCPKRIGDPTTQVPAGKIGESPPATPKLLRALQSFTMVRARSQEPGPRHRCIGRVSPRLRR
jgi:hypothetical protein